MHISALRKVALIGAVSGAIGLAILAAIFLNGSNQMAELEKELNPNDIVVTMQREACLGTCPIYSLTIYKDGTVVYDGIDFVNVSGKLIFQISEDKVKELVDEFYRIDYFSLEDNYSSEVTDLPATVTSLRIDGQTKSVYNYGFAGPEELIELEDKIDKITNSKRWVEGPGFSAPPPECPPGLEPEQDMEGEWYCVEPGTLID